MSRCKSTNTNFSFKNLKPVYLIVLMEHSSSNFSVVALHYIHRLQYSFDSGAETNLLSNYIYISLDTFRSVVQNRNNYMNAWLMFLSSNSPEDIIHLVETYPEFRAYYHDIALFRKNPKELMNMYSEALLQMDKNTVTYMIEEMQKAAEERDREIANLKKLVSEKDTSLVEKNASLAEKDARIAELEAQLTQQQK